MRIIDRYSKFIESKLDDAPGTAERLIRIGLAYESMRLNLKGKRVTDNYSMKRDGGRTPAALNLLNRTAIRSVAEALAHPDKTVWINLFSPTELLTVFGLKPLSIECFAAFMGGFQVADYFLRRAEDMGMSDTLCSYHKCFIGAADTGLLRKPLMSVTTTLACDGNVNTFRYLERRLAVNSFVLDIPFEYSDESLLYVSGQLRSLISQLENVSGKRFDEDALRAALARENEARALNEESLELQALKDYPATLTLHLFKLFMTHILSGSEKTLRYYRTLIRDIRNYPDTDTIKILWIQLLPYYQETMRRYLGGNSPYRIVAKDLDFDYVFGSRLDLERPVEALAKKILCNTYNGPFSRKIEVSLDVARRLGADGAIIFCHWGCKQSAGGAAAMKRAFDAEGIPFLILDGDGIDRRNDAPEQIRTRAEAFFEILEARRPGGVTAK